MASDCNSHHYTNVAPAEGPPTKLAWVAVPSIGNASQILANCCNNPVAPYHPSSEEHSDCLVYCNVTAPYTTHESVSDCVRNQASSARGEGGGIPWVRDGAAQSGAKRWGGVTGYVVFGTVFLAAVLGLL